eukprot:COSAG04_NODE_461_length_13976_cov_198.221878_1_plen_172_part_00
MAPWEPTPTAYWYGKMDTKALRILRTLRALSLTRRCSACPLRCSGRYRATRSGALTCGVCGAAACRRTTTSVAAAPATAALRARAPQVPAAAPVQAADVANLSGGGRGTKPPAHYSCAPKTRQQLVSFQTSLYSVSALSIESGGSASGCSGSRPGVPPLWRLGRPVRLASN